jgi:hypothetical protein
MKTVLHGNDVMVQKSKKAIFAFENRKNLKTQRFPKTIKKNTKKIVRIMLRTLSNVMTEICQN